MQILVLGGRDTLLFGAKSDASCLFDWYKGTGQVTNERLKKKK